MDEINFFCINLDKRKDRWAKCQQQFLKQRIKVRRWIAKPLPENRRFGAGLSHREIIEYAKKNNWQCVGVFEDDISFLVENFHELYKDALEELCDKDWHILYFGGFIGRGGSIKKVPFLRKLRRVENLLEAHAVIYNNKFFDIYLKKHPKKYQPELGEYYLDDKYKAFDEWYGEFVQITYPCFITNKILIAQSNDFSNIENKEVSRYEKSIYRFYIYKHLGTKIATFLEISLSKIKKLLTSGTVS